MNLSTTKTIRRILWKIRQGIHLTFAILLTIGLVSGQASSMQTSRLAHGDSGWIEICGGEDGSYFIKADQQGESQDSNHDCVSCSLCAFTAHNAKAVIHISYDVISFSTARDFAFPERFLVAADCPEKHWSTSRGPPMKKINQVFSFLNAFSSNRIHTSFFVDARTARWGTS